MAKHYYLIRKLNLFRLDKGTGLSSRSTSTNAWHGWPGWACFQNKNKGYLKWLSFIYLSYTDSSLARQVGNYKSLKLTFKNILETQLGQIRFEIVFVLFFEIFYDLKKKKNSTCNKYGLCNYDFIFLQIGGGLGVGGTLWALSKTNYSYLTSSSTSAGIYMLMISVVLLLLTGVVGLVGVLRHNRPVMGSVSVFMLSLKK
jgi:hypothetical protein